MKSSSTSTDSAFGKASSRQPPASTTSWGIRVLAVLAAVSMLAGVSCSELPEQIIKPKPVPTEPSNIAVDVKPGGPVVLTTNSAIFEIKPDGYTQASLRKTQQTVTLDEPLVGAPSESDYVVVSSKELHFTLDFDQARVLEAVGKLGMGKRVEIPSHPLGPVGIDLQRRIAIEVYDKFPGVAIGSVEYKNGGITDVTIDRIISQRHRFSARVVNEQARPYDLWMFTGMGGREMHPEAVKLSPRYAHSGEAEIESIPVVALWTHQVGEAVGNLDGTQKPLSIPVRVDQDGRVDAEVRSTGKILLKPGETYSSPRIVLAVYEGDYHEPLKMWTGLLQAEGTKLPEAAQRELVRQGVGSLPKAASLETKVPPKNKRQPAILPPGATR